MTEPASWLVVEPGHRVVGSDDGEIGVVDRVLGDQQKDIFSGLMVRSGLFSSARYVPAERVAEITTDLVRLDLRADELDALEEQEPPHAG